MSRSNLPPEGWYRDPYGSHEARWFSDGTPTALVRDGRQESQDPPPDAARVAALEPADLPEEEDSSGESAGMP
ncbi:MAG: hypothetical protein ACLPQS_12840 [Acidimicrobiales bacterium]